MLLKQRRKNLEPFMFHAQMALCIPVHLTQVSEALTVLAPGGFWWCLTLPMFLTHS